MNNEFLIGVYKEVGKNPDVIKIKNQKEYLEKLVDGEFTTLDYDDYTIIYKKKSDNLLANVYVNKYLQLGLSIKGKLFIVGKDENGNFISLNKSQFLRCTEFLKKESFDYKNFDEHGKYIPRSKRNKKIFGNKKNENVEQNKTQISKKESNVQENKTSSSLPNLDNMAQALNISDNFFESQLKVEKVKTNNQNTSTYTSNENKKIDTNRQSMTNESTSPVIKLSDEDTLNMILKIVFIILDFVKSTMEDSSDE